LLCLTETTLYIYICIRHFGMANIKLILWIWLRFHIEQEISQEFTSSEWNFISQKFISGKVPCEVSVVVKYTASVKQCGAQNQNLLFMLKMIKIRRKFICFKCKMSKQWQCVVVACKFSAVLKNLCWNKIALRIACVVYFLSLSWLVLIMKMQNVIPTPIKPPSTKLQNNNNNCCISIFSTETSTINYNTSSPTSSHQLKQL